MDSLLTPFGVPLAWASLPFLWAWYYFPHLVKGGRIRRAGFFNNKMPRDNIAWIEENKKMPEADIKLLKRCVAAHANSLEAFAGYGVAMLACAVRGVDVSYLNKAALVFMACRVAHSIIYIYLGDAAKWSHARSAVWFLGTGVIFHLFSKTLF